MYARKGGRRCPYANIRSSGGDGDAITVQSLFDLLEPLHYYPTRAGFTGNSCLIHVLSVEIRVRK